MQTMNSGKQGGAFIYDKFYLVSELNFEAQRPYARLSFLNEDIKFHHVHDSCIKIANDRKIRIQIHLTGVQKRSLFPESMYDSRRKNIPPWTSLVL